MRAFFKEKKHGLIPKLNPALQLLQRREDHARLAA
jgi:hypothetical protein